MRFIEFFTGLGLEVPMDSAIAGMFLAFESLLAAFLVALILVIAVRSLWSLIKPLRGGSSWLTHKTDPRIARVFSRCCVLYFFAAVSGDLISAETLPFLSDGVATWANNFVNVVLILSLFRRLSQLVDVCVGPRGLLQVKESVALSIEGIANVFLFALGLVLVLQTLGANLAGILAAAGFISALIAIASQETASNLIAYLGILLVGTVRVGDRYTIFPGEAFNDDGSVEGVVTDIGPFSVTIFNESDGSISIPNRRVSSSVIVSPPATDMEATDAR